MENKAELEIAAECWCETCGQLEPFSPTWDFGGVNWCAGCVQTFDVEMWADGDEPLTPPTDDDVTAAWKKAQPKQIKYYEKRIAEIKKEMAADGK